MRCMIVQCVDSTCTHAHMHTCTHAHMHTCTHAHMHTCTHAHMQTAVDVHVHCMRSIEQTSTMQPLRRMLQKQISCWGRKPEEGIVRVRHRRICSFTCLKFLSLEECRRSLQVTHLLSLTTFLGLGNLERTFARVRSFEPEIQCSFHPS